MAAVILVVAACAGGQYPEKLFVETRHDTDVDFGTYADYAWVAGDNSWANPVFLENPELPGMIASAVDRELATKGFLKASPDAADFLVAISASVQDVTVISEHRYQGWSHGYNRSAISNVNTATQLAKVAEGTLFLDIIDVASEGVVWQGQAAGIITQRDDIEKAVDAAVARLLEKFPPES